jgi:hypothetical protein
LTGDAFPCSPRDSGHVLDRFTELDEIARSIYHLATLPGISGQVWNLDSRIL